MSKIAFVFPGQGAQFSGMGKDYADNFPVAEDTFAQADSVLGEPLSEIIFHGSKEKLQLTENTQPAILTTCTAIYRVLAEYGIFPKAAAGLSLGEYCALVAAEAVSFEDALPLVRRRGKYMQEVVPDGKGTMAAIMKLDRQQVELICRRARQFGIVEPSNFNCPGQIVISGDKTAIDKAILLAKDAGGRAKELVVSSCFHCSLQQPVEELLRNELEKITISCPRIPVVANCSADYVNTPDQIREALATQVSHPIFWQDSVSRLIKDGVDIFVEAGPGKTVSAIINKIDPRVLIFSVGTVSGLEEFINFIEGRRQAWI